MEGRYLGAIFSSVVELVESEFSYHLKYLFVCAMGECSILDDCVIIINVMEGIGIGECEGAAMADCLVRRRGLQLSSIVVQMSFPLSRVCNQVDGDDVILDS